MKKLAIVAALVAGIGAVAMRSSAAPEVVTQEEVNASVDARLHEILRQRIQEAGARVEVAALDR